MTFAAWNRLVDLYERQILSLLSHGVPIGILLTQAQAEMDTLTAQLAISDPDHNKKLGAVVQTMTQSLYGGLRSKQFARS